MQIVLLGIIIYSYLRLMIQRNFRKKNAMTTSTCCEWAATKMEVHTPIFRTLKKYGCMYVSPLRGVVKNYFLISSQAYLNLGE